MAASPAAGSPTCCCSATTCTCWRPGSTAAPTPRPTLCPPVPRLLAALALLLAALAVAAQALGQTVDITPRPLVAQVRFGAWVTFADGDPIVAPRGDVGAQQGARFLADLTKKSRGLKFGPVIPTRMQP